MQDPVMGVEGLSPGIAISAETNGGLLNGGKGFGGEGQDVTLLHA